jgi:predicted ATPase
MLKRVKIQGYKSLVDVEVQLQPLTVLFGPNASGKSNFLDALQLLSRIATSENLRSAFAPPYRGTPLESFTFGPDGIQGLLMQERVSFSIEVDVELSQAIIDSVNQQIRELEDGEKSSFVRERFLRYHIEIELLQKTGTLNVAKEYLIALTADGRPGGESPFLEWNGSYRRLEGQKTIRLNGYRDRSFLLPYVPTSHPHLVAMRQELASWFFFYLEPRERMRIPTPVKEVRHIGLMGEELAAFLDTLSRLDEPQFKAVEKALHMIIPSITGIDVSVNTYGEVELRLMQGQTPVPASVLSEGTLRILGLLALGGAKEPPSLLGLEEPENGIHPDRLDLITLLLETLVSDDTQVIVTTHSPTLLDLVPRESLYACRQIDGVTSISPLSNWGTKERKSNLSRTLDEETRSVSERLLRGDFDA